MSTQQVRFNPRNNPEFVKELRMRVNSYFKDKGISKYANSEMKVKTIALVSLYFIPFILMLTGVVTGFWPIMAMWILMSLGMSGIGLSVMHDANHGAYSQNPKVNKVLGYLVNFLGAYHVNWKIQHNVLHHSYTNVEGHDDDIENALMRFSPSQQRRVLNRFQAYYAPFLYGLLTINWLVLKDFKQVIKYNQENLLKAQKLTFPKAMTEVIVNKIWYVALTLVLPMIVVDLAWWQILIGFLTMHFISGVILSFIFQLAHVIEETEFFEADDTGSIENNWAVHQLMTTANFARKNKILSWYVGGLNYQVEHHLFPNICHVHYREISKVIKKTAEEYGVPYYEHRTFFGAVRSHFALLNQLGTGSYDKKIAA
jgi:linoleoyl-CoA desaturase